MNAARQQFVQPRPGAKFGPYQLHRELGEGGSAVVFLATRDAIDDPSVPTKVALKILRPHQTIDPTAVNQFVRTARLAQQVEGPHLCQIEDVGVHAGIPYIAMRYLDGATLANEITRRSHATPTDPQARLDRMLRLLEKIAVALDHLHGRGITHRDVKPSNVLVDQNGEPWLLDFGLLVAPDAESTIALAGSLPYLAPELLRGDGTPGVATDLYAFGVTLFEAVTGRVPFAAKTPHELLAEVLAERRPTCRRLDRAVPPDLDVIVDRLLQPRPQDRYLNAASVAEDLRRVANRMPLALRGTRRATRIGRWLRRNPLPSAVLTVLAITVPSLAWLLQDYRSSLRTTGMLMARSQLDAAEREAERLLPASAGDLPALRAWLAEYSGPRGLRMQRQRIEAELAHRHVAADRRGPVVPTDDLTAELRALEQMPHWVDALTRKSPAVAALPALLPSIERHRHDLEAQIDTAASRTDDDATGTTAMLLELAAALAAATDASGIVPRMERELDLLERELDAGVRRAASWRRAADAVAYAPAYADAVAAGYRLEPRPGLEPIGADPRSGLQEFALLRSGAVPQREADGRLLPQVEHAIVFVLLPGGTFTMGATNHQGTPNYDMHAWPEEGPIATVTLAPFLLAKHEMTQAQWRRLGGAPTAALRSEDRLGGTLVTDLHPAEGMSFAEAEVLLRRNGLGLPTEAQWEYAARRGQGAMPFAGLANLNTTDDGFDVTHAPVGSFLPDANGLHDLHGNVAEMIADHFANYDLGVPRAGDGMRLAWRAERISRGGSFLSRPEEARASCRSLLPDFGLLPFVGVRPTLPLEER
jgi:serine/threonine protein kinase/formylglycine-generating enzyme required for sulfatase activity